MADLDADRTLRAYVTCALWSSLDDDTPLGEDHDIDDIAPATLEEMRTDVADFLEANTADLAEAATIGDYGARGEWTIEDRAGHDFWLTRNGHGAGFWDRGLGEAGERLSDAARVYGGVDLYVGDDGKIYG